MLYSIDEVNCSGGTNCQGNYSRENDFFHAKEARHSEPATGIVEEGTPEPCQVLFFSDVPRLQKD